MNSNICSISKEQVDRNELLYGGATGMMLNDGSDALEWKTTK